MIFLALLNTTGCLAASGDFYQILVNDEEQHSVPNVSLLLLFDYGDNRADYEKIIKKTTILYGIYPSLLTAMSPSPLLLFRYPQSSGHFNLSSDFTDHSGSAKNVPKMAYFVFFKYGYEPCVVKIDVNNFYGVEIKLKKNMYFRNSLLMKKFDLLADDFYFSAKKGYDKKTLIEKSRAYKEEMGDIAAGLQKENFLEQAAIVYMFLARMPSYCDENPGFKEDLEIGYNAENLEKKKYFLHAVSLMKNSPQARFEELKFEFLDIFNNQNPDYNVRRTEFLAAIDKLKIGNENMLWPFDYAIEMRVNIQLRQFENACKDIQYFYNLDSDYFSKKVWSGLVGEVDFAAKLSGSDYRCAL